MIKELIFVYNADSTPFALLTDYVHKIVSPGTYSCNLCFITYDNLGKKKKWKKYLSSLPTKNTFLHKDEFIKEYPDYKDIELPVIFARYNENVKLDIIVSKKELDKAKSLEDLTKIIDSKIY